MSVEHRQLADGRWFSMPLVEQMANIGSEVERALNWKARNNGAYCQKAFERALELIDFTLEDAKNRHRCSEPARLREAIVDYFYGSNQCSCTEHYWKKYFLSFSFAARRHC